MSLQPLDRAPFQQGARPRVGFWRDTRALAAVELALILPMVIGVLALVTMGGQGFSIDRKVVLAAHSVTDLISGAPYIQDPGGVSGATQIAQSDLDTDLALSTEILYPHPATNLQVVVSELRVNPSNNTGIVVWSEPYPRNCGTQLAKGAVVALSPAYVNTGASYLIYGQASYTFQPLGILYPSATMTLTSVEMLTVRNASSLIVSGGSTCS